MEPLITEADLLEFRAMAESQMIDTCEVTRIRKLANGEPDEQTIKGVVTPIRDVVYPDPSWPNDHPYKQGMAKRQTYEGYEQTPEVAGKVFTVQRYSVHFPVTSFQPQIGDNIRWVACPTDPDRVGRHNRIAALFNKTLATAQRVFVDEDAGEEPA